MKTAHRLLKIYAFILFLFVAFFAFVLYADNPSSADIFSMILSIVMFSLIPFGILFLLRRHRKH